MSVASGNSPGEFHHTMVKKGDAGFQSHRHAGPINFGQDIVGQIGDEIEELHPFEQPRKFPFDPVVPKACLVARPPKALFAPAPNGSPGAGIGRNRFRRENRSELVQLVADLPGRTASRQRRKHLRQRPAGSAVSIPASVRRIGSGIRQRTPVPVCELIAVITAEQLITAITGKCNRDVTPRHCRNEMHRNMGKVRERLVIHVR